MSRPLRSIAILGGGTAGWMTAAYLERVFNRRDGQSVTIELVESEDIGIIGVGEATVPTLTRTLQVVGVSEPEFLVKANASFKNGIKFHDWCEPGSAYYHPFEQPNLSDGFNITNHWTNIRNRGEAVPDFALAVALQPGISEAGKIAKLWASLPYQAPLPYAYHLDAVRFAGYLRDIATTRGVKRTVGTVVDIGMTEDGFLSELRTKEGQVIGADLFVDCSGFAGLLIEKTLKEPFQPYPDLLCDRAVAFQLPFSDPTQQIRPHTTCTAQEGGWIWEIDLFDRMGTGYVYSSAFTSDEEAEETLCRHHGLDRATVSPRRLKMRVGKRANSWVKNCVAIGLSSGFIEPLESTGIYLIETAIKLLIDYIGYDRPAEMGVRHFNKLMRESYDEVRDFIVLHYVLSRRRDSEFWRTYTEEVKPSDRLSGYLALWRERIPSPPDIVSPLVLFGQSNYAYILAGMDQLARSTPLDGIIDPARSRGELERMRKLQAATAGLHVNHREFLTKIRASFGGGRAAPSAAG